MTASSTAYGEGSGTFHDDGTACCEACALLDTAWATDRPATASTQGITCGATAWGRHARCRREKSKRSDMWFSGARVDRNASVLGCETLTAQGHRGTLSSDASTRGAGYHRTVDGRGTGCGRWTDGRDGRNCIDNADKASDRSKRYVQGPGERQRRGRTRRGVTRAHLRAMAERCRRETGRGRSWNSVLRREHVGPRRRLRRTSVWGSFVRWPGGIEVLETKTA